MYTCFGEDRARYTICKYLQLELDLILIFYDKWDAYNFMGL